MGWLPNFPGQQAFFMVIYVALYIFILCITRMDFFEMESTFLRIFRFLTFRFFKPEFMKVTIDACASIFEPFSTLKLILSTAVKLSNFLVRN